MEVITVVLCLAVCVTVSDGDETFSVKVDEEDRVMVQLDGVWGFVHPPGWDDKDANVVCKSLGFKEGLASKGSFHWRSKMLLYTVQCLGSETHLSECNYTTEKPSDVWSFTYSAVAKCLNERFIFSLVGGPNPQSGWVMATKGEYSGLLCDTSTYWREANINVMCISLGYESGVWFPLTDMPSGNASLALIDCKGEETDINACVRGDWELLTTDSCRRKSSVYCYGKVRLSPLTGSSLGNVFVRESSICASGFDAAAANVVCRELGYPSGEALGYNPFKNNWNTNTYSHVNCSGDEESLLSCDFPELQEESFECGTNINIATVKCFVENEECVDRSDCHIYHDPQACNVGPNKDIAKQDCRNFCNYCPESDWQVLVEEGTIFVSQYGYYGEVYAAGIDDSAAVIMCKNQGKDTGLTVELSTKDDKKKPVWPIKLTCPESAQDINSCTFSKSSDDLGLSPPSAGVFCYNYDEETTLSIEGGGRANWGYLIAHRNGTSGVICSNIWTFENSHVACKEMGFVSGFTHYGSHETSPRDVVFAAEIDCSYNDRKFDMCVNGEWKKLKTEDINWDRHEKPCFGSNLEGVVCHNGVLFHGGNEDSGIVETSQNPNYVFPVCARGFDDKAATVVCRMLGFFGNGIAITKDNFPHYSRSTSTIMDMSCTGDESSLFDCVDEVPMEYGDCRDGSEHPAALCTDSTDDTIRVEGMDVQGRVIVSRYGVNGTICDSTWNDIYAEMFCRQMGYDGGKAKSVFPHIRPKWVRRLLCPGSATSLSDCDLSSTPDTCSTYAGVECHNNDD